MSECDYCDEDLPLWHRREGDELEPAQLIPCTALHPPMRIVELLSNMIDAGMNREDVKLVRDLAKCRQKTGV